MPQDKGSRCSFDGCERKAGRDLCRTHREQRRTGRPLRPIRPRTPREPGATCTVNECTRPHAAKGYCHAHYLAHRKGRPITKLGTKRIREPVSVRLERAIAKGSEGKCWEWLGSRNRGGYGRFSIKSRYHLAHRVVYEIEVGPIPDGLCIDHLCRNRGCVNPKHMEPVTLGENVLRGMAPSAQHARKTHCPQGHPYSGPNLYIAPKTGARHCKTCRDGRERERLAAKRLRLTSEGIIDVNGHRTRCKHGHRLAGDNLYVLPSGRRRCRTCRRESGRRNHARRRAAKAATP